MIDPQHAITLLDRLLQEADENGRFCETSTRAFLTSQVRPALEEMVKMREQDEDTKAKASALDWLREEQ